jgi:hypothetical protein
MDISKAKLVYEFMMKSAAIIAPMSPPMNEKTADNFCTYRVMKTELGDLAIPKTT